MYELMSLLAVSLVGVTFGMAKLFDSIQLNRPKLNKFDMSHEKKLSMNMGQLIPVMLQEVLPGDKWRVSHEVLMRLAPMLAPIMHRVNVYTHSFFVPMRLVWDEWEDHITGGRLGDLAPIVPFMRIDDSADSDNAFGAVGGLPDYLGIPPIATNGGSPVLPDGELNISALPFRAYQLLYDEFFRDQNLEASLGISKASGQVLGAEIAKLTTIRTRAWEKDYFTSALPFAQRGGAVSLPLEFGAADITYKDISDVLVGGVAVPNQVLGTGDVTVPEQLHAGPTGGVIDPAAGTPARIENIESIESTSVTINALRQAVRLQEWLERNARGGGRYIEQVASHFGVISSDARLQRPEYLGGGRKPVVISEVLSSFQADTSEPQGTMAGHGISAGTNSGYSRRFEEHGYVMTILSVLPRTAYMEGIHRMWTRFDKLDNYFPEFANLGEQEVKRKELYADYNSAVPGQNDQTFGYQSRFAEYKYACDSVHGDFRTTLAFWHMGRILGGVQFLNQAFVTADPTHRIFAVDDPLQHKLWVQVYNQASALRPIPYFATPRL